MELHCVALIFTVLGRECIKVGISSRRTVARFCPDSDGCKDRRLNDIEGALSTLGRHPDCRCQTDARIAVLQSLRGGILHIPLSTDLVKH